MPNKNNNIANLTKEQQDALKAATDYMNLICMDYEELKKKYHNDKKIMNEALGAAFIEAKKTLAKVNRIPDSEEYQFFCTAVGESEPLLEDVKANGAGTFKALKTGYMKALHAIDEKPVKENFKPENTNGNGCYRLKGENSIFDEMISLLNSGNATFRGSSDAYKEIEKDLKELKKILNRPGIQLERNMEVKRYAMVMTNAIMEKAARYINKRQNVELKFNPNSYKGKRVRVMNQVLDRLKEVSNNLEYHAFREEERTTHLSENYKNMIKRKVLSGSFTKSLYAEYRALKKVEVPTYRSVEFAYRKNMEDKDLDILADGIQEERNYSFSNLKSWSAAVKQQMKQARTLIANASEKESVGREVLKAEMKKAEKMANTINADAHDPLMFVRENMITDRPDHYSGKMTGIMKLDQAILNAKNEYLKEEYKHLDDEIDEEKEEQEIRDNYEKNLMC